MNVIPPITRTVNKFNFSPLYTDLFNMLKIPTKKILLVGSSGRFVDSVFSGDYDLLIILDKYDIKQFIKHLRQIIKQIDDIKEYYFIELKINKIKYHSSKEINKNIKDTIAV